MAGFQVIMYGRFWVITEARAARPATSNSVTKETHQKEEGKAASLVSRRS